MPTLTNSAAQWPEPTSVALRAERVVIAEHADGTWEPMTIADARQLGGAAAVLEETAPDVFEPVAVALQNPAAATLDQVLIGTTVRVA